MRIVVVGVWMSLAIAVATLAAGCRSYSLEERLAGAGCAPGRTLDIAYLGYAPMAIDGLSNDYARFRLSNTGRKSFGLYIKTHGELLEPYWHGVSADLQQLDDDGTWGSVSVVLEHLEFPQKMLRLRPGETNTIVVRIGAAIEAGRDYRLMVQDEYDQCWVRSAPFRMPPETAG